jgi:hypothetical protein
VKAHLLASLLWSICTAVGVAEGTRIALVGSERGPQVEDVLNLAQAKLSADASLVLLERTEIRRVLDEQKLSLAGVAEAANAVAGGKLLDVHLFAVIESQPGGDGALGLVIFDAARGVRYWDAALPVGASAAADSVVAAVHSATRKQHQFGQGLRTIGLLAVRNADLPRSDDGLCESVGLLFERGLPRSPDVAVLERKRLEQVNQERPLPGITPPAELLASLLLVELEIGRGNGGGLRATALVTGNSAKNAQQIGVQVHERDAAMLAELLLQKVIETLAAAPADAPPSRQLEAQRFEREAHHHYSHEEYAGAVRAMEAATALDPKNERFAAGLALYLLRYATWLFSPSDMNSTKGGVDAWADVQVDGLVLESLVSRASRGVEISSDLLKRGLRDMWGHLVAFDYPMERLCDRLRGARRNAAAANRAQIDTFLSLCRERSLEFVESKAAQAEKEPRGLDHYSAVFQAQCSAVKAGCIDTAQYAQAMNRLTSRWLRATKEWPPHLCKWNGSEGFNMLLAAIVNEGGAARWPWAVDEHDYARVMEPLFAAMQQHARPSVRLYGVQAQIRAEMVLGRISEETALARFAAEYRPLAQSIITHPEPWHAGRTREEVYEAWRSAIAEIPAKDPRTFAAREFRQLGDFLLSRNELRYKIVQSVLEALDPASALRMTGRFSAIINSATLDDPGARNTIASHLNTVEQKILTAHPNLAASRPEVPWSKATKIFDVAHLPQLTAVVRPLVAGEVAYAFGFEFEGEHSALRLIRIPLQSGRPELLGALDLARSPKSLRSYEQSRFVPSACVGGDTVYAATNGAGIVAFPMNGDGPRSIGTREGLPEDIVQSVAWLDGKLYAGLGEGYLVTYDLESARCDVVASSRRKEKRSPFDDQAPFQVPFMCSDPERVRVVFVIGKALWQLTPADGRLTRVLDLHDLQRDGGEPKLDGNTLISSGVVRDDRVLFSTPFRAVEIDLRQNTGAVIHHPNQGVFAMWPPHLVINESLWSADFFASLSLKARTQQRFPPLENGNAAYRPSQCLAVVGDGRQVLAGDERTLWLLDLKTTTAERPGVTPQLSADSL